MKISSFTRNSGATNFGADIRLSDVESNVARLSYDPISGLRLGLLIEEQATNVLLDQSDLMSARWAPVNMTVESINDPNFGTAWRLTDTADAGHETQHRLDLGSAGIIGSKGVCSIYAKSGSLSYIRISTYHSSYKYHWVHVDLETNEGKDDGRTVRFLKCEKLVGDWRRITFLYENDGVLNYQGFKIAISNNFNVDSAAGNDHPDYAGDGTGTVYVVAPQAEHSDRASSYIPGLINASTRAADFADAATGTWYMPGPSTVRLAHRVSRDPNQPVILATNGMRIYQDSDGRPVLDGPGELVSDAGENPQPGDLIRSRWLFDAPDVDKYTIGRDYDDSHWLNSHILDLTYQERRITAAQARHELGLTP